MCAAREVSRGMTADHNRRSNLDGETGGLLRFTSPPICAEVAELADAPGSGPGSRKGSGGSSPLFGTFPCKDFRQPAGSPFLSPPPSGCNKDVTKVAQRWLTDCGWAIKRRSLLP